MTDHTGAQVQLDQTHTQYYIITPADLVALGGPDFILGGQFEMKDGSGTSADLQINLYELATVGLPPTPVGPALATRNFTHTEFCNQLANPAQCGQFNTHVLDFLSPVSLQDTVTYYLELKSLPPPGPQVEAYFIKRKNEEFTFIPGDPPPVPEPSTIGLTALGLIAAFRFTRRK